MELNSEGRSDQLGGALKLLKVAPPVNICRKNNEFK